MNPAGATAARALPHARSTTDVQQDAADRPARLADRVPTPTQPAGTPPRIACLRAWLRGWWAVARGYQRLAYLVGAGLILIGLVHAGMWAVAGGSASGALSWRKPTTFGISFGLTTLTLSWVSTYLPVRPRLGWLAAGLLCAATSYEVAWIVQHARGTPAHFNDTIPLDEHPHAPPAGDGGQLLGQPGLADPGLPTEHRYQRRAFGGMGQRLAQPRQLLGTADEAARSGLLGHPESRPRRF